MSLQTRARGKPAHYRVAAHRLTRLAEALEDATGTARSARRLGRNEFEGDTADAFAVSAATIATDAIALEQPARSFGTALRRYAGTLGEVRGVLGQARQVAAAHRLDLSPTTIEEPTDDPARHDVHAALTPLVAQAWWELAQAEDDLARAAQSADPMHPLPKSQARDPWSGVPAGAAPDRSPGVRWPPQGDDWPPIPLGDGSGHSSLRESGPAMGPGASSLTSLTREVSTLSALPSGHDAVAASDGGCLGAT